MADTITTLRAKYAEILAANDWDIYDRQPSAYVSLTGDAELWRSLTDLSPDFISEYTDLLNLITDIKNTKECHYVDDPEAGGEVFEGRWRQAYIRRIATGEITKLVQVLRKGYSSSIDWTEARLVKNPILQPLGATTYKYLTVQWVGCDPTKVRTMTESLSAASFSDPVINRETYTGVWYNSGATSSISEDGSGTITLELSIKYRDIPFQTTEISADATVSTRQQLGLTTETEETVTSTPGEIRSKRVEVQPDSSKNVITSKDVGAPQTSVVRVVSPSGVSTTTLKTVQASALGAPLLVAGHIKKNEDHASKYPGRFDTSEQDNLPSDQTETSYEQNFFETSKTILHTENSAALTETDTIPGDGEIKSNQNLPTEAGNTKTQAQTRTAETRTLPSTGTITIEADDDSDTVAVKYHNATAVTALTTAEKLGKVAALVNVNFSPFKNRYDYTKIIKTPKIPVSTSGGTITWNTLGGYYWLPFVYNTDGSLYSAKQYQRKYTRTITFYVGATAGVQAAAAANDGLDGSYPAQHGPYLWSATKITQPGDVQTGIAYFGTPH